MPSLAAALAFGAVFGLALAAPPGPMNAVIAQESAVRGWLAGFAAGLGAMTADAVFFVLAALGAVRAVEAVPALRDAMVGVGGLLLLYFAYGAARDATADWTEADVPQGRGFWKALALALTNPYQIVFWLTVGVGLLQPGTVDVLAHTPYVGDSLAGALVVRTGSPALLVGFFGGIAVWITGFPASLVYAGRRVDRFAPLVAYVSAAVLAGFGSWFLADAAGLAG
ncbi:MAG: LysE family translocator [Halobacteriales archaeon]